VLARADDEHDANVSGADPRIIFGGLAVLHSAGLMLVSTSETPTLVVASHLLMGVGMSLAPSSVTSCQQWFDQRRAAASGVGLSGSGVGQFVVAQLIQALIDGNGGESNPRSWRMAMRAQALCGLVLLVPCALVLRKPSQPASGQQLPLHPSQQQQPVTGATHVIPLRKLAGTRTMRTLLPTVASGSIGYMIPFLFISPFLRNKVGLGAQATSWAVSSMGAPGLNAALPVVLPQRERELTGCGHRCGCDGCAAATAASVGGWVAVGRGALAGIANLVGRVGMGILADRVGRRRVLQCSLVGMIASCALFPSCGSLAASLMLVIVPYGLTSGSFIAMPPSLIAQRLAHVPPPSHTYPDHKSRLTEICLCSAIPILILM
jgi:MFS family permease